MAGLHYPQFYQPMQNTQIETKTERIRELNDQLRTSGDPIEALIMNGQLVITRELAANGNEFIDRAVAAVRAFDDFNADNDPWGEHDCATLEVDGETIIFKIDYDDPSMEYHSEDAADPALTRRVLTIMLESDW
jgi:hypothetical protein